MAYMRDLGALSYVEKLVRYEVACARVRGTAEGLGLSEVVGEVRDGGTAEGDIEVLMRGRPSMRVDDRLERGGARPVVRPVARPVGRQTIFGRRLGL